MSSSPSSERPLQEVWPSAGNFVVARRLGRFLELLPRAGWLHIVSARNITALLLAPVFAVLFLLRFAPGRCTRYLLTNRRLVKRIGILPKEVEALPLEGFEEIELEVLPGQSWFASADLRFLNEQAEVFRIPSIQNPETFRHACLSARQGYLAVRVHLTKAVLVANASKKTV